MLEAMKKKSKELSAHDYYLNEALVLAKKRRGFCAPNPSVGAVIVKNRKMIGSANHWAAGYFHAERQALMEIGKKAKGASLYVTLEPCCHWGKTPPCTDIIIHSGIKKVFYAARDPNPIISGKGIQILKSAGILCEQIKLPAIDLFYQSYYYWTQHHLPWVTAKLAMSLDGKIAGPQGEPVSLTGAQLNTFTHQSRRESDAILTTVNTIIHDDPQMNVRLHDEII